MLHIASPQSNSSLSEISDEAVQPNAVDVSIDQVLSIPSTEFRLSKDYKAHRKAHTDRHVPLQDNHWHLTTGSYEVVMTGTINVGEGEAGWIIPRSTLNRNGLFLTSGLYDSGYHGVMAGVLHVTCGPAVIERGARVGQFLLFPSETLHLYNGDYGLNSSHDQTKYKQ